MRNGKATGAYQDFLVGFVTQDGAVSGRPVGVSVAWENILLETDDASNMVWRVADLSTGTPEAALEGR